MNICVISDTHLQNDFTLVPTRAIDFIKTCDLLVHCGDIVSVNAYNFFKGLNKYFVAVQGNWDYDLPFLPLKELLNIENVNVGITHGHIKLGQKASLKTELNAISMFAGLTPEIVIFGHTHIQTDKQYGKIRLINPGSLIEGKKSLINLTLKKNDISVKFEYFA